MLGRRALAYVRSRRVPQARAVAASHALPLRGTVVAVCACDGYDVGRLEASLGRRPSPPSTCDAVIVHMSRESTDTGATHAFVFENGVVVAWGARDVAGGLAGVRALHNSLAPYARSAAPDLSLGLPVFQRDPVIQKNGNDTNDTVLSEKDRVLVNDASSSNRPKSESVNVVDKSDCRVETLDYERTQDDVHGIVFAGDTLVLRGPTDTVPAGGEVPAHAEVADERLMSVVSHGLADSVRLAMLEERLERLAAATRTIPALLARGDRLPLSRSDVLRMTGALLACRAELGAAAAADVGAGATPDRYWSEPDLAEAYGRVSRCMDMRPRVAALSRRLDHADALAAVLRMHLSERHGLKLEWGIIALIAVEVFFEALHFLGA